MSLTCKQACPASLVWIRDLEKTCGAWAGKSACGISGDDVGATLVVAPLPADAVHKTGRPQGSPLQQAMLQDAARGRLLDVFKIEQMRAPRRFPPARSFAAMRR